MTPCLICGGVPSSGLCSACIPTCKMVEGRCSLRVRIEELEAELAERPPIAKEMARLMTRQRRGVEMTIPSIRAYNDVFTILEAHGGEERTPYVP
jgi:hypothetical protein